MLNLLSTKERHKCSKHRSYLLAVLRCLYLLQFLANPAQYFSLFLATCNKLKPLFIRLHRTSRTVNIIIGCLARNTKFLANLRQRQIII